MARKKENITRHERKLDNIKFYDQTFFPNLLETILPLTKIRRSKADPWIGDEKIKVHYIISILIVC